jgi:hypothetical protein
MMANDSGMTDGTAAATDEAQDAILGLQEQITDDEDDVQAHVMVMSSISYVHGQQIC